LACSRLDVSTLRLSADVALVFFSGHGVQIDKRGYLAPTDIRAETESSALRELVSIQEVISKVEHAARVAIIILDACRDSPLHERLRRIAREKSKSTSPAKGLPAPSVLGSNTIVVYATSPGETALDGEGRNSPFTAALLANIERPGLEIEQVFKRVTGDVLTATNGAQQPERVSRLQSELVLLEDKDEINIWRAVEANPSITAINSYLTKYPDGQFKVVAQALIVQIHRQRLLDAAWQEEQTKRVDADKREADLKMREAEFAAQQRSRETAVGSGPRSKQDEALAQAKEDLRRIQEEARKAAEAATAAEQQRIEAGQRAAEASSATEVAKLEAKPTGGQSKLAALPKIEPAPTIRRIKLGSYSTWDTQCSSLGLTPIFVTGKPKHGRIEIKQETLTVRRAYFGGGQCVGTSQPHRIVYYVATGSPAATDHVSFTVTFLARGDKKSVNCTISLTGGKANCQ
jgi:Caspase domain